MLPALDPLIYVNRAQMTVFVERCAGTTHRIVVKYYYESMS